MQGRWMWTHLFLLQGVNTAQVFLRVLELFGGVAPSFMRLAADRSRRPRRVVRRDAPREDEYVTSIAFRSQKRGALV